MKFLAKMNLPNKLTLLRMLCVIAIIVIGLINFNSPVIFKNDHLNVIFDVKRLVILLLFAFGSFTDFLDGYIARKHNLITTFGKFMDPLADKIIGKQLCLFFFLLGRNTCYRNYYHVLEILLLMQLDWL